MLFEPRSRLRQSRRATVRLDDAPDGLPLVLAADRGVPPERLLTPVAAALGIDLNPEAWEGELRQLGEVVRRLVDSRQFAKLSDDDGIPREHYLTWADLRSLIGSTALQMMLAGLEDSQTSSWSASTQAGGTFADTRAMPYGPPHEDTILRRERRSGAKLALALDSEEASVVRMDTRSPSQISRLRAFRSERLLGLQSARFCARADGGTVIEGGLGLEYIEARRQLADMSCQWLITVERRELLERCAKLAIVLEQQLHSRSRVHADLKPANLLLLRDEIVAIDPLDVEVGLPSPGLSKGFAAPEQVLGEAMTCEADQYSLAVVMTLLAGGVLYGQEARFLVPVGTRQLEAFTMLRDPSVFLSPQLLRGGKNELTELRACLERALRFSPAERFESTGRFGETILNLLERTTLEGHVQCEMSYGTLTPIEGLGLCWQIDDRHP